MKSEIPNLSQGLRRLIEKVGSPLVAAQEITTIPVDDSQRGTYRLWFEDGRELKGRHFPTTRFAQVSSRIRETAKLEFLPRVAAYAGDAMLEEWIAGQALAEVKIDAAAIRECGRMQGRLHRCIVPAIDDLDFKPLEIADWARLMQKSLAELVAEKVLADADALRLETLAKGNLPAAQRLAVVNRDLCPENIVPDERGRLFLVDNGSLTIGSIEEDLCRTWYRWPMMAAQREEFSSGYREYGDPVAFENPSLFWRVVVVANSARFRLRVSRAAAMAVLQRLNLDGQNDQR